MDLQALVNEAFARHQAGRLDDALRLYRKVLAVHPPIALVLSLAGEAATSVGSPAAGASLLRKALVLEPRKSAFRQLLAFAEASRGNIEAAEANYAAAIELDPGNLSAMNDWANLIRVRYPQKARHLVRKCILAMPENAEQMRHLAELTVAEMRDAGRALLRRTVCLNPFDDRSWTGLGVVELTDGERECAEAALQRSLVLQPGNGNANLRYGESLERNWSAARIAAFRRALVFDRARLEAWISLGNEYYGADAETAAEHCFRRAQLLDPAHETGAANWLLPFAADCLDNKKVCRAYRRALSANPGSLKLVSNYATFLNERGLFTEAAIRSRAALVLDPAQRNALMGLSNALRQSRKHARVARYLLQSAVVEPGDPTIGSALLMGHNYESGVSAASLDRAHRRWAERAAPAELPLGYEVDRNAGRVLHLGFQSPDLKRHPVGFFLMPVLKHLDRSKFRVSIYSDVASGDNFTAELKAVAERWIDTCGETDEAVRRRIIEDRVDILFDLPGHSASNRMRLFAQRAAPLQMSWMGYVGTTGLPTMDYLVTDRFQTKPGTEHCYTEKWLVLDDDYICFLPSPSAPAVEPTPALKNGYVTFGSFNNPAKVTEDCLDLWTKVLAAVPESRLLLSYKGYDDPGMQSDIRAFLAARGVAPERALFRVYRYHEEFLGGYGEMDVALDTMPYSGGLTTCEALWMGVPVIALASFDHFAGRHSLSHLSNAGFPQWAVEGPGKFVELAKVMAADIDRLDRVRRSMRHVLAASPLCDQPRYVRGVEGKLCSVWSNFCVASEGVR